MKTRIRACRRCLRFLLIAVLSAFILVVFLKPSEVSSGLNRYERSKFIEMVQGTARRPLVQRTFLPTTVRFIATLTPNAWQSSVAQVISGNALSRAISQTNARSGEASVKAHVANRKKCERIGFPVDGTAAGAVPRAVLELELRLDRWHQPA